jgi:peptide/nickel transport system substrate-binding protein
VTSFDSLILNRRLLIGATSILAGSLALAPSAIPGLRSTRAQEGEDVFTIANEAEPVDLLPWFGGYGPGLVTRQIYETLAEPRMTLDADGKVVITLEPVLAESWERVDDTRWRFTLRQGVTFHNGEAFNADAVKASFDVLADSELATKLGKFNILAIATGCDVVDEFTVDFVTAVPTTEFVNQSIRLGFSGLPPAALAANGIESFAQNPIGTGPYQFKSWSKGEEIVLDHFAGYWDANGPAMPSLRYVARPEAAVRAQTVAAGEADFAYNIGAEQASALDYSVTGGGFQSTSIRINNAIAPTNDLKVRQAINYAIDRDAIVETVFGGKAVSTDFFGFQPVTLTPYAYDLEQAKALIAEAGAAGTELEFVYGEGRIPEEDQLAEIYKAELDEIGLKIKLTKVEPRQYNELGGLPFEQQPPLYMETTSSGNYGEIASGLQDKYGCEGTGTYCDPAMDEQFALLGTLEGDERTAKLQEIAEALHAAAPRAWVAVVQQVHGLSERVVTDLPLNAYIRIQDVSTK